MLDTINKDTLKPGDVVGIRIAARIGWGFFRYAKTIPMTIERITPARTKFVMTNGNEFTKHEPFYPVTEKSQHETSVAICAENISTALLRLDELRRNGKLYKQDDDFIVKTAEQLTKILDEVV